MIDFQMFFATRKVETILRKYPVQATRGLKKGFQAVSAQFIRDFTKERLSKSGKPSYGDPRPGLYRRTGSLAKAIAFQVRGSTLDTLSSRIGWYDGEAARRAIVHEEGAKITPKGGRYLAIPIGEALTPAGVPRRAGPRDWPNTFVMRSKKGNLLIVQKAGGKKSKGGIKPLYVLKESVKIPPRLEFFAYWNSRSRARTRVLTLRDYLIKELRRRA